MKRKLILHEDSKPPKASKRIFDESLRSIEQPRLIHSSSYKMTKKTDDDECPQSSTSTSKESTAELLSSSFESKDVRRSDHSMVTSGDIYPSSVTSSGIGGNSSSFDNLCEDSSSLDNIDLNSREEMSGNSLRYLWNYPKDLEEGDGYFKKEMTDTKGDGPFLSSCPSQSPSPKLSKLRKTIIVKEKRERMKKTDGNKAVSSSRPHLVDYNTTSSDSEEEPTERTFIPFRQNPHQGGAAARLQKPYFNPLNFASTSSPRLGSEGMRRRSDPGIESSTSSSSIKFNVTSFMTPTCNVNDRTRWYRSSNQMTPRSFSIETVDTSPGYVDFSPRTELSYPRYFHRKVFPVLPDYDIDDFSSVDDFRYIDTHCHLDFLFKRLDFKGTYKQFRDLNSETFPKSYEGCVAIFCDPQTFERVSVWQHLLNEDNVWGAFGCHPHMAREYNTIIEEHLLRALDNPKVVALGEIGLDYSSKNNCDHDKQKSTFRRQLSIALDKKLPLVIHSRDSSFDTMEIMKEIVPNEYRIHRHCFTGDWAEASYWLKQFSNLYIGLTALVTFQSAKEVHDVARNIPLDRLLLETDTPYFLPRNVSKEKRFSHPGMAIHVAAQIASLRMDTTLEDVLKATRENTRKVYGI